MTFGRVALLVGVAVLVLVLMVGVFPVAPPFTSTDCVKPAICRTNSTGVAPEAATVIRRDCSENPGELIVTR